MYYWQLSSFGYLSILGLVYGLSPLPSDFCLSNFDCINSSNQSSQYCSIIDGKCTDSRTNGDPCNPDVDNACFARIIEPGSVGVKSSGGVGSLLGNSDDSSGSQRLLSLPMMCFKRDGRCRTAEFLYSVSMLAVRSCSTNRDCPISQYCDLSTFHCRKLKTYRQKCRWDPNFDLNECLDGYICSPHELKCVKKCDPGAPLTSSRSCGGGGSANKDQMTCLTDWAIHADIYIAKNGQNVSASSIPFGYCLKTYTYEKEAALSSALIISIGVSGIVFMILVFLLILLLKTRHRAKRKRMTLKSINDDAASRSSSSSSSTDNTLLPLTRDPSGRASGMLDASENGNPRAGPEKWDTNHSATTESLALPKYSPT